MKGILLLLILPTYSLRLRVKRSDVVVSCTPPAGVPLCDVLYMYTYNICSFSNASRTNPIIIIIITEKFGLSFHTAVYGGYMTYMYNELSTIYILYIWNAQISLTNN